jgi:hypothetical protein
MGSVNGNLPNGTPAWGLNDETTSCSSEAGEVRVKTRPEQFCQDVVIDMSLSVATSISCGGPITCSSPLTVDGIAFAPVEIIGVNGVFTVLGVLTGPVPPPTPPLGP